MARVTAAEVQKIIDVSSEITDLDPFIDSANRLVTAVLGDVSTSVLSDDQKTDVELWLAAHFITIWDNRRSSEKAGSVGESYQYKLGLGLKSSMYGQQAMMLDTTGKLAALDREGGIRSATVKALT